MADAGGRLPGFDFRWLFRTNAIPSSEVGWVQGGECELGRTGIGRIDATRQREADQTCLNDAGTHFMK